MAQQNKSNDNRSNDEDNDKRPRPVRGERAGQKHKPVRENGNENHVQLDLEPVVQREKVRRRPREHNGKHPQKTQQRHQLERRCVRQKQRRKGNGQPLPHLHHLKHVRVPAVLFVHRAEYGQNMRVIQRVPDAVQQLGNPQRNPRHIQDQTHERHREPNPPISVKAPDRERTVQKQLPVPPRERHAVKVGQRRPREREIQERAYCDKRSPEPIAHRQVRAIRRLRKHKQGAHEKHPQEERKHSD